MIKHMRRTAIRWVTSSLLLTGCSSSTPSTEATGAPDGITCEQKTFPNIPGQNRVTLKRGEGEKYRIVWEAYSSSQIKRSADCVFDKNDARVFNCRWRSAAWGIESTKTTEHSIGSDGVSNTFDGYIIETIDSPEGDDPTVRNRFRFNPTDCKLTP